MMKSNNEPPLAAKPWLSWCYVTLWSLAIFATIPLARQLESFINQTLGRDFFLYAVLGFFIIAGLWAWRKLSQRPQQRPADQLWLLGVCCLFIAYTFHLRKIPVEAFHFCQYSILSLLIFRALSHRLRDVTIYFSAAALGATIGALDEAIQWLTPGRYWGISDIWINFFAIALVQIGIAKGYNPTHITGPVKPQSLCLCCRLLLLFVAFMQLNFLNTPPRIAGYAEKVPLLAFLKENEAVMIEYGDHYDDPEIGFFRSRFSPSQLKTVDLATGPQGTAIIEQFAAMNQYRAFLKKYTPVSAPFLHELRVHLYSRNLNLKIAQESKAQPKRYTKYITRAYRENQILEKYYGETFKRTTSPWPPAQVLAMAEEIDPDVDYQSQTSEHLITRVGEEVVNGLFLLLLLGLLYGQQKFKNQSLRPD